MYTLIYFKLWTNFNCCVFRHKCLSRISNILTSIYINLNSRFYFCKFNDDLATLKIQIRIHNLIVANLISWFFEVSSFIIHAIKAKCVFFLISLQNQVICATHSTINTVYLRTICIKIVLCYGICRWTFVSLRLLAFFLGWGGGAARYLPTWWLSHTHFLIIFSCTCKAIIIRLLSKYCFT